MLPLQFQFLDKAIGEPGLLLQLGGHTFLFDAPLTLYDRTIKTSMLNNIYAVLLTHRHRDHFGGIDRLFFESETLPIVVGNTGTQKGMTDRLTSYDLNLTELSITAHDILWKDQPEIILRHKDFHIEAIALTHGSIHSIAYALQEKSQYKIIKDKLDQSGFRPGPWVREAKLALEAPLPPSSMNIHGTEVPWEDIATLFFHEKGQRIVYASDFDISTENHQRLVSLLNGCDHFFCEAAYLADDHALAIENNHQTSHSTARLALDGQVKTLHVFHHSRRYQNISNAIELFHTQIQSIYPHSVSSPSVTAQPISSPTATTPT